MWRTKVADRFMRCVLMYFYTGHSFLCSPNDFWTIIKCEILLMPKLFLNIPIVLEQIHVFKKMLWQN